jgi:predicted nucleotidyltransferase
VPGDPREADIVDLVITSLVERTGVDPGTLLLIGAEARNVLHARGGHDFPVRSTTDLDLGIAVVEWQTHDRITSAYPRLGTVNGIRYSIDGVAVDLMPFGAVEDPTGITRPPLRGDELIVFGFDDVFAGSTALALSSGHRIRIPTVPGYAALKLRAFLDRSVTGEGRDAEDLALATYWYQADEAVEERVWTEHADLVEDLAWDLDLATAFLLGTDIGSVLSPVNREDLRQRWESVDIEVLSRSFAFGQPRLWTANRARRRALVAQIAGGLASSCASSSP